MAETPLALSFTSLLLALKSCAILSELGFRWRDGPLKQRITFLRLVAAIMGSSVFLLGSVAAYRNPNRPPVRNNPCTKADADIVGDGVRTATWVQVILLASLALGGAFYPGPSATQEVGAGLVIMHIALAIALLVPMHMQKLSPVDSILGTMLLDAQNAALSIQLLCKQTLASRWQTYVVILSQLAGLATIGVLIQNFQNNRLAVDECECISVYWWGWLSNCSVSKERDYRSVWMYFTLRSITAIHYSLISSYKTFSLDKAKRREEYSPCEPCLECHTRRTQGMQTDHPDCKCSLCGTCNQCTKCYKMNIRHCTANCAPGCTQHCTLNCAQHCTNCDKQCNRHCNIDNNCHLCLRKQRFQENDGFVGGRKYSQLPASLGLTFYEYSMYALQSLFAVEALLKAYRIQPSSPWSAIGQVTSTVIAGTTALRSLWVAYTWYRD